MERTYVDLSAALVQEATFTISLSLIAAAILICLTALGIYVHFRQDQKGLNEPVSQDDEAKEVEHYLKVVQKKSEQGRNNAE